MLDRGYAIVRKPGGEIITSAEDVTKGDLIEGLLASGRMVAQVVGALREGQAAPFEVGGYGVARFQRQGGVPDAQQAVDFVAWARRRRRGRFSPWGWCLPFPDAQNV